MIREPTSVIYPSNRLGLFTTAPGWGLRASRAALRRLGRLASSGTVRLAIHRHDDVTGGEEEWVACVFALELGGHRRSEMLVPASRS